MSTLTVDTVTARTADSDLSLDGNGTGVVDLGVGYKVGGTVDPLSGVAPGTSGNLLTSNGSAWTSAAPAGGGAWTLVSSATVSSPVASVEIVIPDTYEVLALVYNGFNAAANAKYPLFYMSTDAGSTYPSLHALQMSYGGDGSAPAVGDNYYAPGSPAAMLLYAGAMVSSTNGNAFGTIMLYNTPGQPLARASYGTVDQEDTYDMSVGEAVGRFTSALGASAVVDKVKFTRNDAGNIEAGTFRLYGLANS